MSVGEGAGVIITDLATDAGEGAGLIITGSADEAGEASITLGLGLGEARPTPINAKFESSSSRGQGFSVK